MKKTYVFCLSILLAMMLLIPSISAVTGEDGEIDVSANRFMCDTLNSELASFSEREDGSLLVTFRNGAPTLNVVSPALEGTEECNAIRIVLKNNSACNQLFFRYTYRGEIEEIVVPITRRGDKESYYIYPKNVEGMSDISIRFSGVYSGTLELYSMSAVSIYDDSAEEPGDIQNCIYDPITDSVRISGTVDHAIATDTRNSTVEVYAFDAGIHITHQQINEATPLATAPLSVRFEFEVKDISFSERFLQYVVAIMSPDRQVIYAYTPHYPCVMGAEEEAVPFKGIHTQYTVLANRADTGLAIVDVEPERLQSPQNNGLLHIADGNYFYIDRSYIYELDEQIKQYGADGCRVYLRFLLSEESFAIENETASDAPKAPMSDADRLRLFAYTDFLCERYSAESDGLVSGIVVGRAADDIDGYSRWNISAKEYTRLYADVLYTVSEAARAQERYMDIVVPVSNRNDYTARLTERGSMSSPELFLTSLCKLLNDRFGNGLAIRVMVEDDTIPGVLMGETSSPNVFSAENIEALTVLLQFLEKKYECIKDSYLYYWMPEDSVRIQTLCYSYVYAYYRLSTAGATAMVLSTENLGGKEIEQLFDTVKYIDTQLGEVKNKAILDTFKIDEWGEVIPGFDFDKVQTRNVFVYENYKMSSGDLKGRYIMWDYQQGRSIYDWYADKTTRLTVKDVEKFGRVLVASITPKAEQAGYSEIIYDYSADEIMSVVDMLSMDVAIDGESGTEYKVIFEICGDHSSCEVSATISSGEKVTVYLSTLKLDKNDSVRNIRVFSAPIESDAAYEIYIENLAAHSNSLDDESLAQAIVEAKLNSTTTPDDAEKSKDDMRQFVVVLTLTLLCIVPIILLISSRRRGNEE